MSKNKLCIHSVNIDRSLLCDGGRWRARNNLPRTTGVAWAIHGEWAAPWLIRRDYGKRLVYNFNEMSTRRQVIKRIFKKLIEKFRNWWFLRSNHLALAHVPPEHGSLGNEDQIALEPQFGCRNHILLLSTYTALCSPPKSFVINFAAKFHRLCFTDEIFHIFLKIQFGKKVPKLFFSNPFSSFFAAEATNKYLCKPRFPFREKKMMEMGKSRATLLFSIFQKVSITFNLFCVLPMKCFTQKSSSFADFSIWVVILGWKCGVCLPCRQHYIHHLQMELDSHSHTYSATDWLLPFHSNPTQCCRSICIKQKRNRIKYLLKSVVEGKQCESKLSCASGATRLVFCCYRRATFPTTVLIP